MIVSPSVFFALLLGTMLRIPYGASALTAKLAGIRRKLDRESRPLTERAMRGAVVLGIAMLASVVAGEMLMRLCDRMAEGRALEILLLAALIGPAQWLYPLWRMVRASRRAHWQMLDAPLRTLAAGDAGAPDGHGKLRLGAWLAWRGAVHILGGVLAFVAADFSGLLLYKTVQIMALQAHPYSPYDLVICWCARLLALPAQCVARALLWCSSWLVPGLHCLGAVRHVLQPDAAFVAALMHATLGGPGRLHGRIIALPWVGSGTAQLDAKQFTALALGLSIMLLLSVSLLSLGTV
jgi:hypothetical protein